MGRSARVALTAKQVENSTKLGYTADGKQPGLNLQVAEGAHGIVRSWVFRYVFPDPTGKKGMSNGALLAVIKGMPAYAAYVPHGFRSTFRDWAAETTNFANETLELALAHTIKDKAEAA